MTPSEAAAPYRIEHPAKAMMIKPANSDQMIQKDPVDGFFELPSAPASPGTFKRHTSLPQTEVNAPEARHLWVIRLEDFPVALETCSWGKTLQDKVIKHSNLTGGADAHSGGELWFIADDRIVLNAASGRYGAADDAELNQIVDVLRGAGYTVASMGFDVDNPAEPNTLLVGDPVWLAPL